MTHHLSPLILDALPTTNLDQEHKGLFNNSMAYGGNPNVKLHLPVSWKIDATTFTSMREHMQNVSQGSS